MNGFGTKRWRAHPSIFIIDGDGEATIAITGTGIVLDILFIP
jgi:hypothetical protein